MQTRLVLGPLLLSLACSAPKTSSPSSISTGETVDAGTVGDEGGASGSKTGDAASLDGADGNAAEGADGAVAEGANADDSGAPSHLADSSEPVDSGAEGSLPSSCALEQSQLEREMAEALEAAATDPDVTQVPDFSLVLETADGHRFLHTHGDSSLETRYESASTSKWVAAAVILDLVDRGLLRLQDEPSNWLPFWKAEGVTLAHLLSFTSGFSQEPLCFNSKTADFADCVERAYQLNATTAPAAGSEFDYSSTHLQIAGLMAIRAASVGSWAELFASWQAKTGLFPSGAFDLPSSENPRLAGGMHWTGSEYLQFLRSIYHGTLLSSTMRTAMLDDERGNAKVVGSPTIDALKEDWAYGFGNWLECPTAIGPNTFDCGAGHRNSSPGAYGAYPFIDFDHHYFGILARQGALGTFRDGDSLFRVVAEYAANWAEACAHSADYEPSTQR